MAAKFKPILVLGATGYVGGRLVPLLLEQGHTVRAAGRSVEKIRARPWGGHPNLEAVAADALDQASLERAMDGCGVCYYLVHSMQSGDRDFAAADRKAAYNMVRASRAPYASGAAGLERIIYLGGLGDPESELSEHLHSRMETGEILGLGTVPVTWLRAAVILGSGSASFEIVRYLTDRLPVMLTPRWVRTKSQPISIESVLGYLTGCLEARETVGQTLDIGGPDILSYKELFQIYAEEAGLRRRLIIPVPALTPKLSAHWVNVVTPVPKAIIEPLIDGLRNECVCRDDRIRKWIPLELPDVRETIRRALQKTEQRAVESCCYDAGQVRAPEWTTCGDAPYAGGDVLRCDFSVRLRADAAAVWEPVRRIGGETGWYYGDVLWHLRGWFDKLIGGPGDRRGRRHPTDIAVGDVLDFWRVLDVREGQRLLLLAEMKVPGDALLEFRIVQHGPEDTELFMLTRFLPRGLLGHAYWWSMYPSHFLLFGNMLRRMADAALAPITDGPGHRKVIPETCRLPEER